ncbi:MAG: hypothetical protein WDW38_002449 [Sanguina aurantia]
MDPESTRMAMEAMGKMSPDQMQQMMKNMPQNMSPDFMQTAMAQMKNMKPSDWDAAKQQLDKMSPEDMSRQAAASSSQMSAQQQYTMTASAQLKAQGNQLHSSGKFSEAAEKYERAKGNVANYVTAPAAELRKACTLNLSSCYLNLNQFSSCVAQCGEVLADDPKSVKALYRRGQALAGLLDWEASVTDLTAAFRGTAGDPVQQGPIKEKLQAAKDQLSRARANGTLLSNSVLPTASAAPAAPAASAPGMGMGGMSPALMQQAADMMRDNPAMAEQAQRMMASMDPETLRSMGEQFSGPGGGGFGSGMDPATMAKMAASMPPDLMQAAGAGDPGVAARAADMLRNNPAMMSSASDMLAGMSPEQLDRFAAQSGLPAGLKLTPELARSMASTMKGMSPELLQSTLSPYENSQAPNAGLPPTTITDVTEEAESSTEPPPPPSSSSHHAAPPPGSGAHAATRGVSSTAHAAPAASRAGPAGMDPRAVADLLSNMDPAQLEAMTAAMPGGGPAGMKMTPELAKMAAQMMKNMSPAEMSRMAEMAAGMKMGGASNPFPQAPSPPQQQPAAAAASSFSFEGPSSGSSGSSSGAGAQQQRQQPGGGGSSSSGGGAGSAVATAPAAAAGPMGLPGGLMTPEAAKMAANMMANMSPADMARMTEMASSMGMGGGMGGMAGMPAMTPEMAKMASSMMANMKPEDMAQMAQMAASFGATRHHQRCQAIAGDEVGLVSWSDTFAAQTSALRRTSDWTGTSPRPPRSSMDASGSMSHQQNRGRATCVCVTQAAAAVPQAAPASAACPPPT